MFMHTHLKLAAACRFTCENVMRVLRSNKDSVMAMLEAFVHDPLINWRLLNTTTDTAVDSSTPTNDSGMLEREFCSFGTEAFVPSLQVECLV